MRNITDSVIDTLSPTFSKNLANLVRNSDKTQISEDDIFFLQNILGRRFVTPAAKFVIKSLSEKGIILVVDNSVEKGKALMAPSSRHRGVIVNIVEHLPNNVDEVAQIKSLQDFMSLLINAAYLSKYIYKTKVTTLTSNPDFRKVFSETYSSMVFSLINSLIGVKSLPLEKQSVVYFIINVYSKIVMLENSKTRSYEIALLETSKKFKVEEKDITSEIQIDDIADISDLKSLLEFISKTTGSKITLVGFIKQWLISFPSGKYAIDFLPNFVSFVYSTYSMKSLYYGSKSLENAITPQVLDKFIKNLKQHI